MPPRPSSERIRYSFIDRIGGSAESPIIPSIDEASWFRLVGFVPQQPRILRASVEENIRFFQTRGVTCPVLTMGGEGSIIAMGEERIRVPAYPIDVVDTTGCGDAYTAGFIAGLVEERSLMECAHLGTAAASLVASGLGSDAGIVERAQTEAAHIELLLGGEDEDV